MANFPGLVLTASGRDIQSKAQTGQPLHFTRIGLGAGAEPDDPKGLYALVDERQSLSIQVLENLGNGTSKIRAILTNQGLKEGFFVREIGVYAQDPDTHDEVLYSYSNSADESDFMPAEGGATLVEQTFDLVTVVGSADNITAVIDDYLTIATKKDVEEVRNRMLPEGGIVGQMVRRSGNNPGDVEWFTPEEGIDIRVSTISEMRTAIDGQTVFSLQKTTVQGLSIYVEGRRLNASEWARLSATQVRLKDALQEGQVVEFVNNEPLGDSAGLNASVSLTGPRTVYASSQNTYHITDFSDFSSYGVATDVGHASIDGSVITLDIDQAASGAGSLTVTRDGIDNLFSLSITAAGVASPSIQSPVTDQVVASAAPSLTSTRFTAYPEGYDTHDSSDWQLATDPEFQNIVWESLGDKSHLESVSVPVGVVSEDQTYYVRCRHNGTQTGSSQWGEISSFVTASQFGLSAETAMLMANDATSSDRFGLGLAIDKAGSRFFAGAPLAESSGGISPGAVYVFDQVSGAWMQTAKISPSSNNAGERFGESVACTPDGNTLIVGAYAFGDSASEGEAYIYEKSAGSWNVVAKLKSSEPEQYGEFGFSVDINDDATVCLIGSRRAFMNPNGGAKGKAEIFKKVNNQWVYLSTLVASDGSNGDEFGHMVRLSKSGSMAFISAPDKDIDGTPWGEVNVFPGCVYVFKEVNGDWQEVAKIIPQNITPKNSSRFGCSLDINDDESTLIVGCERDSNSSGSAFIYKNENGSWVEKAKFIPTDLETNGMFGCSVVISGDGEKAVIAAHRGRQRGTESRLYLYEHLDSRWTQTNIVYPETEGSVRLAYDGNLTATPALDLVVAGDAINRTAAHNAGSIFIFS